MGLFPKWGWQLFRFCVSIETVNFQCVDKSDYIFHSDLIKTDEHREQVIDTIKLDGLLENVMGIAGFFVFHTQFHREQQVITGNPQGKANQSYSVDRKPFPLVIISSNKKKHCNFSDLQSDNKPHRIAGESYNQQPSCISLPVGRHIILPFSF